MAVRCCRPPAISKIFLDQLHPAAGIRKIQFCFLSWYATLRKDAPIAGSGLLLTLTSWASTSERMSVGAGHHGGSTTKKHIVSPTSRANKPDFLKICVLSVFCPWRVTAIWWNYKAACPSTGQHVFPFCTLTRKSAAFDVSLFHSDIYSQVFRGET